MKIGSGMLQNIRLLCRQHSITDYIIIKSAIIPDPGFFCIYRQVPQLLHQAQKK